MWNFCIIWVIKLQYEIWGFHSGWHVNVGLLALKMEETIFLWVIGMYQQVLTALQLTRPTLIN